MSTDIIATLLKAFIIEEGLEVSSHFFRDLSVIYQSVAEELIKKYAENAKINDLSYNRDREEEFVNEVITDAIMNVGQLLDVPQNISTLFLRYTSINPEFDEFNRIGLQKAIMRAEERLKLESRLDRDLPSWERIEEKIPDIKDRIIHVVEMVKSEESASSKK